MKKFVLSQNRHVHCHEISKEEMTAFRFLDLNIRQSIMTSLVGGNKMNILITSNMALELKIYDILVTIKETNLLYTLMKLDDEHKVALESNIVRDVVMWLGVGKM